MVGVSGAVFKRYDSDTEAYRAYGLASYAKAIRTLGADDDDETPTQSTVRANEPERRPITVSAREEVRGEIEEGPSNSPREIVVQCPPISSPRPRSVIQRASTLPAQHTPRSPSNTVQRSRTVPDVDSRSTPSTPKKVRVQKSPASNVSRSRGVSVTTEGFTTDEESIPSSPATNVSSTLSPNLGHLPLSPPRDASPSRPSPTRKGGDNECRHHHRTPTTPSVRGSRCPGRATDGSPSKRATNSTRGSVRCTTRGGTSRQPHPLKRVVWDSPPQTNRQAPKNTVSHAPHDRSGSRPPPSPSESLQLTYASDDEDPAGDLTRLTMDTDYYTPSSRGSERSDSESEASELVSPSTLKGKGKRRASPPPPSPDPHSSPPSSHMGSSPRNPSSVSGRSHKKRRDRYTRPRNDTSRQETREQSPAQDPSQLLAQDVCHCAGPCPSCHKQRHPFPPQYNPMMYPQFQYQYVYLPSPHIQSGYQMSPYGHPPYPYPYPMSQHADLLPSISSAQPILSCSGYPIHPPPATHIPTSHSANVPVHASPPSAPTSSISALEPSTSAHVLPPPVDVGSPPADTPVTQQAPPEILGSLGQFRPPPQPSVKIIDPSYDPRSPYSKKTAVPVFPIR